MDQAGSIEEQRRVDTEATRRVLVWVQGLDGPGELSSYPRRVAKAAAELAHTGALTVSRTLGTLNDALSQRLLTLAEQRLGPPPQPYAWLVLGSGGRGEQALVSDQDNAVVYETADPAAASYFGALAGEVVERLATAGFPRCPGGYMATRWHHPLAEWERVFHDWIDRPEPQSIVEAEVFLDFRRVHGSLGIEPLDAILSQGGNHPRFLVHMARAAIAFPSPLNVFGRLHGRDIDLKRGGLAAIVLLARLYALAGGSVARPTLDRLDAADHAGTLSADGARRLASAYRLLSDVRLGAQLEAIAADRPPDNTVPLHELDAATQRELRQAFRIVREMQEMTALHFPTHAIT